MRPTGASTRRARHRFGRALQVPWEWKASSSSPSITEGHALRESAAHLDVFPRRIAVMVQPEIVIALRRELVGNLQRKALAAPTTVHHQVVEQPLALHGVGPYLA